MNRVSIIGSGFSGLSSACFLAKEGFEVEVFEKNDSAGGRARKFKAKGFTFDMGPSWYWMPDVFDDFFAHFGKTTTDYYKLVRLDPSYQVIFSQREKIKIPAGLDAISELFETLEPGSSKSLKLFLNEAAVKYRLAMKDLVFRPGLSITELMSFDLLKNILKLQIFQSVQDHIRHYFKSSILSQILEFPVLFLGAKPENTPALYSLMNYADMVLGTWYPMGGIYEVVRAMESLARSLGVKFSFNSNVEQIETKSNQVTGIIVNGNRIQTDYLIASADYHHVEQNLLPEGKRQYTKSYWDHQVMAPSALIYFLGSGKKVDGLVHHNLFFDTDFKRHAKEIYDSPQWPAAPQFYVSCPSRTDSAVVPPGGENLFILIPTATGLADSREIRDRYLEMVLTRIEAMTGSSFRNDLVFTGSYAHSDFIQDYNAFKGNAYGLANTLRQTANLKPSIVNKKLINMFYTGQLTVPGPGVPPAIISGQVTATQLLKRHRELVIS